MIDARDRNVPGGTERFGEVDARPERRLEARTFRNRNEIDIRFRLYRDEILHGIAECRVRDLCERICGPLCC